MTRKAFKYTSRLGSEGDYKRKTLKELYEIGLFVGHFLRRNMYNQTLIKALRSGNDVYFLARDMTVVQGFFKDSYPNAKTVYGVSRIVYNKEQFIREQVNLNHKGLVVDSGFAGSCVKPVIRLSDIETLPKFFLERTNDKDHNKRLEKRANNYKEDSHKLLKGLLFSGESSSYFSSMTDNNKSRSHRSCIIDLEHSPKTEVCVSDEIHSTLDKDIWKRERAFRLGLYSGFMNLNAKMLVNPIKRETKKNELIERYEQAQKEKYNLRQTFKRLDDFARYGAIWFIGNGKLERVANKSFSKTAYYNGKKRTVYFSSVKVAKRALEIYAQTEQSQFMLFEGKVANVRRQLARIETAKQQTLKYYNEQLKAISVSEEIYMKNVLKPFKKLDDKQRAINELLGISIC